jgi:hypothetical protein
MLLDFCVSHFSDEQQKHFLTHRRLTQHIVSVLQHASAHKWGKVQGQYPCMRFGAAGSSSVAANAVSLFNSRTSYIHTHAKNSHKYTSFHLHILTYTYTHSRTHSHTYIHTHIHTYTHAYIHSHIHTYIHTCMHAYIHTYIRTYARTHIHTCIHTATPYMVFSPSPLLASSFLFPPPRLLPWCTLFPRGICLSGPGLAGTFVWVFFTGLKLCLAPVRVSAWLTLPGYICFESDYLWSFWPVSRGYCFVFPPVLPVFWRSILARVFPFGLLVYHSKSKYCNIGTVVQIYYFFILSLYVLCLLFSTQAEWFSLLLFGFVNRVECPSYIYWYYYYYYHYYGSCYP